MLLLLLQQPAQGGCVCGHAMPAATIKRVCETRLRLQTVPLAYACFAPLVDSPPRGSALKQPFLGRPPRRVPPLLLPRAHFRIAHTWVAPALQTDRNRRGIRFLKRVALGSLPLLQSAAGACVIHYL